MNPSFNPTPQPPDQVATADATLHFLEADTCKWLRSYRLVLAGATQPQPRLTALSLLPSAANTASTSPGGHMLCAGFEDGSLRRFAVADLMLEQPQ